MQGNVYLVFLCYFICLRQRRNMKHVSVYVVKEMPALGYLYNNVCDSQSHCLLGCLCNKTCDNINENLYL